MSLFVTLGDVIQITIFLLLSVAWAAVYTPIVWRRMRCKHDGKTHETQACDEICAQCGKNLGFISRNKGAKK